MVTAWIFRRLKKKKRNKTKEHDLHGMLQDSTETKTGKTMRDLNNEFLEKCLRSFKSTGAMLLGERKRESWVALKDRSED